MQTNTYEISLRGHSMPYQLRRYMIYSRKSTEDPNGLTVIEYDWHPIIYIYHWISLISQIPVRDASTHLVTRSLLGLFNFHCSLLLRGLENGIPGACRTLDVASFALENQPRIEHHISTWLNMINHANPRKSTGDPNGLTIIEYDWHPIIYIYIT